MYNSLSNVLEHTRLQECSFTTSDEAEWNENMSANRNVFGSIEFARIYEKFFECVARLYVLKSDKAFICHPILLKPISDLPFASDYQLRYDAVTPEYSGPIIVGNDDQLVNRYSEWHNTFTQEQHIIAEFAYLHPWKNGAQLLSDYCVYNRDIVWVDVSLAPDILFHKHFEHSCRKNIKKAYREGVTIFTGCSDKEVAEFHQIYIDTMHRNQALEKYLYPRKYFFKIRDDMSKNAQFVFAEYNGKIIAATLFLHDDDNVYSYLGGAVAEFNHLRPTNLVIWETVRWAHEVGKKRLILGAGYQPNDGIFQFKATFSPHRQPFYVYKRICLEADYAELDKRNRQYNRLGEAEIEFFPSYRFIRS